MEFEPVIGLEIHAELQTQSKMFCACAVVDFTQAAPNSAVCPVCAGMPGTLPVLNQKAVEYALRVALALQCEIAPVSIFARKNYFYPDLPKGYQISQYEQPLARNGLVTILTSAGQKDIRIRRVHLEEDTGKLTHLTREGQSFSLLDLNRAGIPLLEIVTEPDFHAAQEVRAYATLLRAILSYLGVNSGDMQKGVMRIEPNISLRPAGSQKLGTRVEIKNLNSFRALERSVEYEIKRQSALLRQGKKIRQETLGWDDMQGKTFTQRVKEGEDDYRYFPEPDLPPLVVDKACVDRLRSELPELPSARQNRLCEQYDLSQSEASLLVSEHALADFFEEAAQAARPIPAKTVANWITGELFALINAAGIEIGASKVSPSALAELISLTERGEINQPTAKTVLAEMFASASQANEIITSRGLLQISDSAFIQRIVAETMQEHPDEVSSYRKGKKTVLNWLFGQVMKKAGGKANPQMLRTELERQLG